MASQYRSYGFIFRKRDAGEFDRVFSVFTKEYGRVELFAKGLRKIDAKLRGGLDVFYWSDLEFIQGKSRKTVTDARLVKRVPPTKAISRIARALHDTLRGEEKDGALFALLEKTAGVLEGPELAGGKEALLYWHFIWNLLAHQGKRPELRVCVACKGALVQEAVFFSPSEGGTVCAACAKRFTGATAVSVGVVKALRLLAEGEWAVASRLKLPLSLARPLAEITERSLEELHR